MQNRNNIVNTIIDLLGGEVSREQAEQMFDTLRADDRIFYTDANGLEIRDDVDLVAVALEQAPTVTIQTVNELGLLEIKEFLAVNHKKGGDHFTREMLQAWAAEAEFSLSEGNGALIEIRSWDSVDGCPTTFTVSGAGLDSKIVEA